MKTLQFKCELLSDIILNQKAATEGPNATLDFIPGSNFLGIVAGKLYSRSTPELALTLFHSGKVRFGDAHVANGANRTLHIPADMYEPKLTTSDSKLYIMHKTDGSKQEIRLKQLKQCREGYFDFSADCAKKIDTAKNFAIKSAHDKQKRTSANEKMYGYQSLEAGLEMYFSVEVDDDSLADMVEAALIGKKRVGRSRTAQYGLVTIESNEYESIESRPSSNGETVVYAESRLIFLDDNNECTFMPTADQLGVVGDNDKAVIDWEKSQIRTFQYSPWNYKRQCFDTDRCGIEKGSVIVVKGGTCKCESTYLGSYNNEGFGRVIYNPAFLEANEDGTAKYQIAKKSKGIGGKTSASYTSPLLTYLSNMKAEEERDRDIYSKVNTWVHEYGNKFRGENFASQWGSIRSMASQQTPNSIEDLLFADSTGYLMHGTAEEKWIKGNRRNLFRKFVEQFDSEASKRLAIINLASEMAKHCRKEDKA